MLTVVTAVILKKIVWGFELLMVSILMTVVTAFFSMKKLCFQFHMVLIMTLVTEVC